MLFMVASIGNPTQGVWCRLCGSLKLYNIRAQVVSRGIRAEHHPDTSKISESRASCIVYLTSRPPGDNPYGTARPGDTDNRKKPQSCTSWAALIRTFQAGRPAGVASARSGENMLRKTSLSSDMSHLPDGEQC